MEAAINNEKRERVSNNPGLSAWIWRPWYAKLWWVSIPVWWLGMAAATRVSALDVIYGSALAGFLNILFFPMTALMVLGVGYVRERLDGFVGTGDGAPLSDEEEEAFYRRRALQEHDRLAKRWHAGFDPSDPRSGPLWIGNPMNPTNPGHINPHTGKFNAS